MAVFTPLSADDIRALLARYDAGDYVSHDGILSGVENTNFVVETTKGRFVATLIERRITPNDLPFILGFADALAAHGIPAASPLRTHDDALFTTLKNKPALLTPFLDGTAVTAPTSNDAAAIGDLLARMHTAAAHYPARAANRMALPAWRALLDECRDHGLPDDIFSIIDDELMFQSGIWQDMNTPSGACHLDLFPDNVFFKDGGVSGVIDFYFSATAPYVYDLMLTVNAWCYDNGKPVIPRLFALIEAYDKTRPLSTAEKNMMPALGRAAALRIFATRQHAQCHPQDGGQVTAKDPLEYLRILISHRMDDILGRMWAQAELAKIDSDDDASPLNDNDRDEGM